MKNPPLTSEASQFPQKTKEGPQGWRSPWILTREVGALPQAHVLLLLCFSSSRALRPHARGHIHTSFSLWRFSSAPKPGVSTGATETSRDNTVGTDAEDATAMSTSVSGGALPPGTRGFLCISSFHLCCNHRERTPPPFHTSSHRGCSAPTAHRPLLSSQNNSLAPS